MTAWALPLSESSVAVPEATIQAVEAEYNLVPVSIRNAFEGLNYKLAFFHVDSSAFGTDSYLIAGAYSKGGIVLTDRDTYGAEAITHEMGHFLDDYMMPDQHTVLSTDSNGKVIQTTNGQTTISNTSADPAATAEKAPTAGSSTANATAAGTTGNATAAGSSTGNATNAGTTENQASSPAAQVNDQILNQVLEQSIEQSSGLALEQPLFQVTARQADNTINSALTESMKRALGVPSTFVVTMVFDENYLSDSLEFSQIYAVEAQNSKVTAYEKSDRHEYFAGSFKIFVHDPEALKADAPLTYDFISRFIPA